MRFLILGPSVGKEKEKKQKKLEKKSRRPGISTQYPWSLEITSCGNKVNMAAMEEGKINVMVKLKREQRKKDEPPKLYGKKLPMFRIKVTFV